MSVHYIEKCEHGTVGGQCRCPAADKTVINIECPDDCPRKDEDPYSGGMADRVAFLVDKFKRK